MGGVDTLVTDSWIDVYYYLSVVDIISTRRVCKTLRDVTLLRPIWLNVINGQIIPQGIQLPGHKGPLRELSGQELEAIAVKATKLARNLAIEVPGPIPADSIQFTDQVPHINQGLNRYITQALFLPGTNGARWLMCVSAGYRISLWEILSDPLQALPAGRWDSPASLLDVVLNKKVGDEATFTVTSRERANANSYRALILNISNLDHGCIPVFKTLETLEMPPGRLIMLHGDAVVFYRRRWGGTGTVVNWRTKQEHKFLTRPVGTEGDFPSNPCKTVGILSGKLVVVTPEYLYVWKYDPDIWEQEEASHMHILSVSLASYGAKIDSAYLSVFRPEWRLESHQESSVVGITIITRRKGVAAFSDEVIPYVVYWSEGTETVWYTQFEPQHVGQHFCADVRLAPSGRGFLVVQARDGDKIAERLESIDFIPRDRRTGLANSPIPRLVCRPISLRNSANGIMTCTSMDYDDAEGRVVVASSEGKISLFEFA